MSHQTQGKVCRRERFSQQNIYHNQQMINNANGFTHSSPVTNPGEVKTRISSVPRSGMTERFWLRGLTVQIKVPDPSVLSLVKWALNSLQIVAQNDKISGSLLEAYTYFSSALWRFGFLYWQATKSSLLSRQRWHTICTTLQKNSD